jgi:hypothetical protein
VVLQGETIIGTRRDKSRFQVYNPETSYTALIGDLMKANVAVEGRKPAEPSFIVSLLLQLAPALLLILIFMLWAFTLPGHVSWDFVPERALFGLDTATHQHDRITGPIAAVWLLSSRCRSCSSRPTSRAARVRRSKRCARASARCCARSRACATSGTSPRTWPRAWPTTTARRPCSCSAASTPSACSAGTRYDDRMHVLSVFAVAGGIFGGFLDRFGSNRDPGLDRRRRSGSCSRSIRRPCSSS